MKKLLALIFVALCTIGIEAQEKYVAIERNAETGAYTLSKEFKAVLPMNEDGTYGDVATNKDSRGSVVVMKTASVTVEAVGASTPAKVPDVAGDNTATHFDINPDGTVNSWYDIKWQQKNQGDINWAWIQGTGNPAASIEAEVVMTDDVPATYVDADGVEHTKYSPKYTFYNPDGSLGVPEMGLYYKVTATTAGTIKIGTWVNKGNRKTYVVDAATALPIAYLAEGYINGQNHKILPEGATDSVSVKKYLTTAEIDSIHKANCTDATTGEDTRPYVIGAGNQPFFGYITFEMEAGKTYYVFCENTQLGFNGWIFDKYITFADSKVKALCVANWDTNSDGELSYAEAAAVTDLGRVFSNNKEITSFNELQYFTGLTSIYEAFHDCSNLTSIIIPGSVTSIDAAFPYCSSLTSIVIPSSVTSIVYYAFYDCSSLTSIVIPNSVTSIGSSAFSGCSGLNSITIPNSVTSMGEFAFGGCTGLTTVTILEGIKSISKSAFARCTNLTSITIPSTVTSIGAQAFAGCYSLNTVTVGNSTPVELTDGSTFSNRANATLYVPAGSKAAYEKASVWNEFKEIIEIENITFADSKVKEICVANWDVNKDGELSYAEAAAVTSIGRVFSKNKEITSFNELQYFTGLTSIGNNAFSGCSGLTSVSIPSSVTSIGVSAFYGCSGLTGISIPSSVTSIDWQAFSGCSGLTSIVIPGSLTSIGISAFSGCSGLTTITVEAGNPVYDSRNNCNAIIEIATNELISGCKNTVIPSSVTSIGSYAFEGCSGLTCISIPSSVTSIGTSAFYGCSGLTSVSIPSSVTSIGWQAFSGCTGLTTITVDADNPVCDSRNNCNAIIETATNELIFGCKNTTIPSSVTSIGNCAFYDCSGLTGISIPNSVTSIGNSAFFYCTRLTSVSIPSSVTSIGDHAFYCCYGLTSVTCKSSTPLSLGEYVFSNRAKATLYVPAGSKTAYEEASVWNEFKEIIEIINITFADSKVKEICMVNWDTNGDGELSYAEAAAVTSIGDTFKNNTDIVSLDVLQYFTGLDSISRYAFYGCTNLASVIIPESVDSIFSHAFRDCPSLTSLNIPANVKYINDAAIRNTGITELTVDENNTIYDSRNNCNAVIETSTNTLIVGCNSTVIPDNVVTIGAKAFHSNSFITTIELPNSVTSIQNDVFNGCTSLTEIIIPSGVTDIGSNAFKGCTNLVSVTSLATTPPVAGTGAFKNINSDATLHVPSVSIEEYRKTEPWSNFGSIVALKDGQNNRFIVNDMDVLAGQSFVFPVGMINEIEVTAFQCDVYLPEGITLQTKKGKYDITLDENRKDDHTVTSALQEDGAVRIIVASLNNSTFSETSGILFNLNLIVAEGISATLPITIKNIHISDTSGKETILGDVTANLNVVAYTPGDVNNDGLILVNDVVTAINYILNVTPENFVFAAADMDGNGQILVNDVVQIINTILGVNSAKENGARATITKDADKFYMDDFIIKAGESKQVAIKFDTENVNPANPSELNYVAFQFDLCLPKGLTVVKKKEMYDFKFNEDRMGDHTFTSSLQADGSIRVVATSLSNAPFCEKSHDFILFTLTASDDFAGSHKIAIENINFSDKAGEIYKLPVATSRVTDDVVNGISSLDASDNKAIKIYTIDGKCVMKSAIKKGVYIANGKKFYVK